MQKVLLSHGGRSGIRLSLLASLTGTTKMTDSLTAHETR